MTAPWYFERLAGWGDDPALVWGGETTSYRSLLDRAAWFRREFEARGVAAGSVVALDGSFSPEACAALLGLFELSAIIVPLTSTMRAHREKFLAIAEVGLLVEFSETDEAEFSSFSRPVTNAVTHVLQSRGHAGLVIFSSGSTGAPKAILHDLETFAEKFRKVREKKNTLSFLLFDHIGGIDTLLGTWGNGGTIVTVAERDAETVAMAVAAHRVHTLPASPTFLNLLLISGAWQRHDLSSLKVVAYGTEPMPQTTLERLRDALPDVSLVQTYGMSELGVLRSRSREVGSLWIKFSSDGFRTKIVDGILWVKAEAAMLGYLNAPDLFDEDGWLNTQDAVEVDGEYVRILGRASDLINVGGQKVYPSEVENVLLNLSNVADVAVFGKPNAMTGQMVAARFNLEEPEPLDLFKRRMYAYCREHLANFQVPRFVELTDDRQFGARFKKVRRDQD